MTQTNPTAVKLDRPGTRHAALLIGAAAATLLAVTAAAAPTAAPTATPAKSGGATTTSAAAAATAPKSATLSGWAIERAAAALDAAEKDGRFDDHSATLIGTMDVLIAHGGEQQAAAFREVSFAWRVLSQLRAQEDRVETLKFLRKNLTLAHTLAFLMQPEEDAGRVYRMLGELRKKHEKLLETYATLAAAICVVHDRPLTRSVNENRATAPNPVALFEYYVANERAMYFGIRNVPAELLVWVVDSTSSIEEMTWALKRYAKDDAVGRHFFDIKYDLDHLRRGTTKKVTQLGLTLPNILTYGGVCVDQAHFATEIGKAIGVPTATASGASSSTGHAWVGFLQARGKVGGWNFDVGRYPEYKGVRGLVLDPQTRERIPDSFVSLTAELIGTTAADRETAAAFTDAARRVGWYITRNKPFAPAKPEGLVDLRAAARPASVETALDLLDTALKKNVGYAMAWYTVRDLAHENKLSLDQKKRWSDQLLKLCGGKYPDFALEVLIPMIRSVPEVKEQDRIWSAAFAMFQPRPDLAAEVRMNQAQMWLDAGDAASAGKCYLDVINRYANAGPFVIPALAGCEKALKDAGKPEKIVSLYMDTWKVIVRPKDMAGPFLTQSNWYRVGTLLASKMAETGDARGAAQVRAMLEGSLVGGKTLQ